MKWTLCKSRRATRTSRCNTDRGCTAAKITSAVLLSGLGASAAATVIAMRRRREVPPPAEGPPRVDDPLR